MHKPASIATISSSVTGLVGNTPLFLWRHRNINLYLKLEMFNPGGSIKDRVAALVVDALVRQRPKPARIVEYSSGNLGIALALYGRALGLDVLIVATDKTSNEKVRLLKALGASVVITRDSEVLDSERGMIGAAAHIAASLDGSYFVNQFHNPLNPQAHYASTGSEVWRQMEGNVDVLVAPVGTGGTITGVARYMKERRRVCIIGATPVAGLYHSSFHGNTPSGRPSSDTLLEGVGGDFVPGTLNMQLLDDMVEVGDSEAYEVLDRLRMEKGLLLGESSGLALAAALKYASGREKGANVVVICADGGERYLSKIEMRNRTLAHQTNRDDRLEAAVSVIRENGFPHFA